MIATSVIARRNVRHISTRYCMKCCSCVGWIASRADEDFPKNLKRISGRNIWWARELLAALTITSAQAQITVDGIRDGLNDSVEYFSNDFDLPGSYTDWSGAFGDNLAPVDARTADADHDGFTNPQSFLRLMGVEF